MGEAFSDARARYGVDAPGVMAGLLCAGFVGLLAGVGGLFLDTSFVLKAVAGVVAVLSMVVFGLGAAMGAYAVVGKLRLRDWMLEQVEWEGNETVLDVGAGRGLMAVGAAQRVPGGRVIAVDVWRASDLSGNGPEGLMENAETEGVRDRIEVVTAHARKLDLPDGSVDVVFSVLCLHNIEPEEDLHQACAEMARVLKAGGRALIGDYVGTASYARMFRGLALQVDGPLNKCATSLGLMWVLDVKKKG